MKKYPLIFFLFFNFSFLSAEFNRLDVWVDFPGIVMPYVGHTWFELIDEDGTVLTYEINMKGIRKNKAVQHDYSIFYSWPINGEQAEKIIDEMEGRIAKMNRYSVFKNNCVHIVKVAMKLADIPHPDFMVKEGMPTPRCLHGYLTLLNEGYTPKQVALKYGSFRKFYTPVGTKYSLKKLLKRAD